MKMEKLVFKRNKTYELVFPNFERHPVIIQVNGNGTATIKIDSDKFINDIVFEGESLNELLLDAQKSLEEEVNRDDTDMTASINEVDVVDETNSQEMTYFEVEEKFFTKK
ncbi:hypothetical protein ACFL2R_03495 [Patescibacteria group bacterium]